jgi:predicted peroxiredoxin
MAKAQATEGQLPEVVQDLPPEYILYVGTHGMDDPTRAGLIFAAANQEDEEYEDAVIALLGDAVFLLNETIAEQTRPSARNSLKDLINEARERKIKIFC